MRDLSTGMAQADVAASLALLALAEAGHAEGVPDPASFAVLESADWANDTRSGKGLLVWAKLVVDKLTQSAGGLIVVHQTLHPPPS
jgi:hypothetical protein